MSLKIEFVERATLDGANMSALCREFGISRQTGHKWLIRFKEGGYSGLEDQSRRPKNTPLATAEDVVMAILAARQKHPTWGPRKLVVGLKAQLGADGPSERTIARVLSRFAQVRERKRRPPLNVVERAPVVSAKACNDVWTIDFKGWWRSIDGLRCEPLTVRDAFSRYVLAVELVRPTTKSVRKILERLFKKHGRPKAIQCDNGLPFIVTRARGGLTKLSAWWVSLGIQIVRSRPAKPQDNGAHERMHRDISAELQQSPAQTMRRQQTACEKWRQEFNHVRPHEALGGRTPADIYKPTPVAPRVLVPQYPPNMLVRRVGQSGTIRLTKTEAFIGSALHGHTVGLERESGLRYRVWFYQLDLGLVEIEPTTRQLEVMLARADSKRAQTEKIKTKIHLLS